MATLLAFYCVFNPSHRIFIPTQFKYAAEKLYNEKIRAFKEMALAEPCWGIRKGTPLLNRVCPRLYIQCEKATSKPESLIFEAAPLLFGEI